MKALTAIVAIIFVTVTHAQTDQAETERVLMRFREPRHESSLQGANWSLAHQSATVEGAAETHYKDACRTSLTATRSVST